MSISSKIKEINDIKTDLTDAINSKLPEPELYYNNGLVDYPLVISHIPTGGTPPLTEPKDVNFIDYDGTLIYAYTKAEFIAQNALPAGPTHEGLVFQEWNWTLAEILEYLQDDYRVDVGANYTTTSGNTRIYVRKTEDNLWQYLTWDNGASQTNTIDWGDGNTTNLTAANGVRNAIHKYSEPGEYVIELYGEANTIYLGSAQSSVKLTTATLTGGTTNFPEAKDSIWKIEMGTNFKLYSAAFYRYYNLETISVCKNATYVSNTFYAFTQCPKLKTYVFPHGYTVVRTSFLHSAQHIEYLPLPPTITTLDGSAFAYMRKLKYVLIPKTVTTFGDSALTNCVLLKKIGMAANPTTFGDAIASEVSLETFDIPSNTVTMTTGSSWMSLLKIKIPEGTTTIADTFWQYCYSARTIDLPSTLTTIGANSFASCYSCMKIICRATPPPTIQDTSFAGFDSGAQYRNYPYNSGQKIYVPQGCSATYKAAENWTALADYIYDLAQVWTPSSGGASYNNNGITITPKGDGITWTISGTATSDVRISNWIWWANEVLNHKFVLKRTLTNKVTLTQNVYSGISMNNTSTIQTGKSPNPSYPNGQAFVLSIPSGTSFGSGEELKINMYDLTLIYGAGNEPATFDDFKNDSHLLDEEYYPYSLLTN